MQSTLSSERSSSLINTLHGILKPFLLRRLKADVMSSVGWFDGEGGGSAHGGLPPKKEYVLWAPLTEQQRTVYNHVLSSPGGLRSYLLSQSKGKRKAKEEEPVDANRPRKLRSEGRAPKRRRYNVDADDDAYFEQLEQGETEHEDVDLEKIGNDYQYKATRAPTYLTSPFSCILTSPSSNSKTGEQHETAESGDAASESVLAPVPVRLAPGHQWAACVGSIACACERENARARPTSRRAFRQRS